MGTSESKMAVSADTKPDPAIKKIHAGRLVDPRSPSAGIDRTPIQFCRQESKTTAAVNSECPLAFNDPRSPTVGVTRTPVREFVRATVGSFAHRLGLLFHNEAEGKVPQKRSSVPVDEVLGGGELASTEPLLTPLKIKDLSSLAEHANLLATPVQAPQQFVGSSSPFELLWDPQVEVEIETEADISLEEAEEARETPLHKRLSMSLITCHEGATSSQIIAEVHSEGPAFSEPDVENNQLGGEVDHSYAVPSIAVQPESSTESPVEVETEPPAQEAESPLPPSEELVVPSPEQQAVGTGIRCPSFDTKSPSQLEFKPQWLGKGFGATGLRSRGVQGNKGGSSPLAVRVAVKGINNENKRQSGKLKNKGTEGRSPLQILKETNSPCDQRNQLKLKASNQSKQRLGQMDRRVLAVSMDKEN
ncbi:cell division cycle-associated protein 3 [Cyprinodon tularosa]|uniref:cell division cycle-associated protein 3 n=1 Tax=Cyprinodon tularosa TaxID=77115 RepID=UPI0018E23F9E|nr:cell division cycle-associated protein 3 [Cyprinodon tularosa]XP_038140480.1 cell division cycle-associated protein 3 [Cyprinodon tularosa]